MKETILLFHIQQEQKIKFQKAFLPLHLKVKAVKKEEYMQTIGSLAGIKGMEMSDEIYSGDDFEQEMMVMSVAGFGRVEQILAAMKKAGLKRIDYKAVLTDSNQNWNALKLYGELKTEHERMKQKK